MQQVLSNHGNHLHQRTSNKQLVKLQPKQQATDTREESSSHRNIVEEPSSSRPLLSLDPKPLLRLRLRLGLPIPTTVVPEEAPALLVRRLVLPLLLVVVSVSVSQSSNGQSEDSGCEDKAQGEGGLGGLRRQCDSHVLRRCVVRSLSVGGAMAISRDSGFAFWLGVSSMDLAFVL